MAVRALFQVPTVNFSLFSRCIGDTEDCLTRLIRSNIGLPRNLDATAKAPTEGPIRHCAISKDIRAISRASTLFESLRRKR